MISDTIERMRFLILLALFVPTPSEAQCTQPIMHPKVMTANVTTVEGGVVVSTEIGRGDKDEGGAVQPKWVFKSAGRSLKPEIVTLAPGLVLYKPPGKLELAELHDGTKVVAKWSR